MESLPISKFLPILLGLLDLELKRTGTYLRDNMSINCDTDSCPKCPLTLEPVEKHSTVR